MSNVTNWTNITDVQGFLNIANTNSGGYFWTGVLWMIFIVMIISLISFGFEVALLVSAFIGLILSLTLLYMGLVSLMTVGSFVGIILIMFLYIVYSSSKR